METLMILRQLISDFFIKHGNLMLGLIWLLNGIAILLFNTEMSRISGIVMIAVGLIYLTRYVYLKIRKK